MGTKTWVERGLLVVHSPDPRGPAGEWLPTVYPTGHRLNLNMEIINQVPGCDRG